MKIKIKKTYHPNGNQESQYQFISRERFVEIVQRWSITRSRTLLLKRNGIKDNFDSQYVGPIIIFNYDRESI